MPVQVDKLTGRGAPPDFIAQLQVLASQQQGITQVRSMERKVWAV